MTGKKGSGELKLSNEKFKAMINDNEDNESHSSMSTDEDNESMVKVLEVVLNNQECMLFCHESMMEGRKLDLIQVLKVFAPCISSFGNNSQTDTSSADNN